MSSPELNAVMASFTDYVGSVKNGVKNIIGEICSKTLIDTTLPLEQDKKVAHVAMQVLKVLSGILLAGAALTILSMACSLVKGLVVVAAVVTASALIYNYASNQENMNNVAKKYNDWWNPAQKPAIIVDINSNINSGPAQRL